MIYEIKNDTASAKFDTLGATWKSFVTSEGKELLWQADPKYWDGSAPILFPIVGALRNDSTIINDKAYTIPKHGLVRTSEFDVVSKSDDCIVFEIKSNEETLKAYPFNYSLKMAYKLLPNAIETSFTVTNLGDDIMPYFVGGHPAFNTPFEDGFGFEDYVLEFACEEDLNAPTVDLETSLIDFTSNKLSLKSTKQIKLNHELFYNDALIFDNLKKNIISIKNPNTGKHITVNFEDFTMIGIWRPYIEGAPFVCLEPWIGCGTTTSENDELINKRYVQYVGKGESKTHTFTVCFDV